MSITHAWAGAALAIVAASAVPGASAAEVVALDWSADGRFATTLAVPAGGFVEACGTLPARTRVHWRFDAGTPLDFNVHFHVGKQVRYPARRNGVAKAGGRLDAKVDQDYCWMWTNRSQREASVAVELTRGRAPH